jgi:hypothetical protein
MMYFSTYRRYFLHHRGRDGICEPTPLQTRELEPIHTSGTFSKAVARPRSELEGLWAPARSRRSEPARLGLAGGGASEGYFGAIKNESRSTTGPWYACMGSVISQDRACPLSHAVEKSR